jgi:hypothetical protein
MMTKAVSQCLSVSVSASRYPNWNLFPNFQINQYVNHPPMKNPLWQHKQKKRNNTAAKLRAPGEGGGVPYEETEQDDQALNSHSKNSEWSTCS